MAAIRQISALFIFMALCHFGNSNPTKDETIELSELVKNLFHPLDFEKLLETLRPQHQSKFDKSKSDYLEPSNPDDIFRPWVELENLMAKESLESEEFLSHLINYDDEYENSEEDNYKKKNPINSRHKKYKKDKAYSYEPRELEYNKKPTSTHKHKKLNKLNTQYIKGKDSNDFKNVKQNIPADFSNDFKSVKENIPADFSNDFKSVKENIPADFSNDFKNVKQNNPADFSNDFKNVKQNIPADFSNDFKNVKENIPAVFPPASALSLKGKDGAKDKSSDQSDYNDSSAIKADKIPKNFYEMNRPSVPATKKFENTDEYINEIRNEILINIIENLSKQLHKGNVNTEAPTPNSSSGSMFDSYYIPKGPATVSVRHNGATKDTYGYGNFDGYILDENYPPIGFYDPISGKKKYLIQLSNGKIAVVPGRLVQRNKHEKNYNKYYKKMFKYVPKDLAYERPGVKRNNQPVKLRKPNPYIYSLPYVAHSTDDTAFLTEFEGNQLSLPENKNDDKNKMDESKEDKNKNIKYD